MSENVDKSTRSIIRLHHPPFYGGDMHNGVIWFMEEVMQSLDIATLKFNFPGTTQDNSYFGARGAVQDALMAVNYMKINLEIYSIGVAVYSFGGSIALALSPYYFFSCTIPLSASLQLLHDACESTSFHEKIM